MKIANITFHDTSNFGATLQCAALSRCLKNRGYDVMVINYLPQYVLDKKSIYKQLRKVRESGNKLKALVKGIAYLFYAKKLKKREKSFEKFIQHNLILSDVYHTFDELKKNPPTADFYICGSDQIWNPSLTGNMLDKAFFLQFTDGPRAAYGVSFGELDIKSFKKELRELTNSFFGISVREKTSAVLLKETLNTEVKVVLDCTLLLDSEDYRDMEVPIKREGKPYLLLYNIQNSAISVSIAEKVAEERHLCIVDVSPNPFASAKGAQKLIDIGPGEFLSYIKYADYVVTNSFHGTVFSIIYKKPFFTIPHKTRSGRTSDLLESLDLEDRLINDVVNINDSMINYERVSAKLVDYKRESLRFLDNVLNQNKMDC